MNGTALHLPTGLMTWIEHEETLLLRAAKTVQINFDRIILPIIGIGLAAWVVTLFATVFVRYSECAKIIALCSK